MKLKPCVIDCVTINAMCLFFSFFFFWRCFPVSENPSHHRFWGDLWQSGTLHWCTWDDHWFTFQGRRPLGQCSWPPPSEEVHEKEKEPPRFTVTTSLKVFNHHILWKALIVYIFLEIQISLFMNTKDKQGFYKSMSRCSWNQKSL